MINNKKPFHKTFSKTKATCTLCVAGLVSLSLSAPVIAHDTEEKKPAQTKQLTPKKQTAQAKDLRATSGQNTFDDKPFNPADYVPDPAKRLTEANFVKGATRLHGYLKNAVEKANDADKRFLVKEKQEMERQLANPKAALAEQFKSIEAQMQRLYKQNVFPDAMVAQMHQHFLETEAGKAVILLQNQAKRKEITDTYRAELSFQQGIAAQRDQVNLKTALRHYSNAVKLAPKNIEYLDALGDLFILIEDNGSAEKLYKDMLVLLKTSGDATMTKKVKAKLAKASKTLKMANK